MKSINTDIKFSNLSKKEKIIYTSLFSILMLTTIIDLYTALKSPIFRIAESNPIILLTHSVTILVILTIIISWFVFKIAYTAFRYPKLFIGIIGILYISLGHLGGAYSNIIAHEKYLKDPEATIQEYQNMQVKEKASYYFSFVFVIIVIPLIVAYSTFMLVLSIFHEREGKREKLVHHAHDLLKKYIEG